MDLRTVHNLFTDCWKLYKEFSELELNDSDLDRYRECSRELGKKYGNNKFAVELVVAVSSEIGRICNEKRR